MPVHDPLRRPRRTRREEHPQRVGERHRRQFQRRVVLQYLGPRGDVTGWLASQPGHQHGRLQRRQLRPDVGELGGAVDPLAVVERAIAGHQHGRFQLSEPSHHPTDREVLVAHRPGRADGRCAEEGRYGLADVGQVADDAVTGSNTLRPKEVREGRGLLAQPLPRPVGGPVLARRDQGRAFGGLVPEHLGRVVELYPWKPLRARHTSVGEHHLRQRGGSNVEVPKHRVPEPADVVYGRLPQLLVVGEVAPAGVGQPRHEPGEVGGRYGRCVGCPIARLGHCAPSSFGTGARSSPSV